MHPVVNPRAYDQAVFVAKILGTVLHHSEVVINRVLKHAVPPARDVQARHVYLGILSSCHLSHPISSAGTSYVPIIIVIGMVHEVLPILGFLSQEFLVGGSEWQVVMQFFPIDEIVPKTWLVCPPFADDH